MPVLYDSSTGVFHLQAKRTSYVFRIHPLGVLEHLYWGSKIRPSNVSHAAITTPWEWTPAFCPVPDPSRPSITFDNLAQEFPAFGNSDFRHPVFQAQLENGSTVSELRYAGHRIYAGKPGLQGLPATYVENDQEAETLEIDLLDALTGLKATLLFTVFHDINAITRSVRFRNGGKEPLKLLRAMSVAVDMPHDKYRMLQLSGAWGRERQVEIQPLRSGIQSVESRRGASSHMLHPFLAFLGKDAGEDYGEVFGFSLVYSGNFLAQAEVDQFHTTRVTMGINPFDFTWLLEPGETFQAPEVVMVHSAEGLGDMSRTYHRLYRSRLCRGAYRDAERPILINNWEATYFDFDAERVEAIAKAGSELGLELFVLDDGWFGVRNDDRRSLGDWFVNREKLPGGIEDLVNRVTGLGMRFGLWFEPEMVSPDSDLYRAHPDWCLHVPNRTRSESRNQLVLDMSREDVCDAVIKMVSDILRSAPITYVKWDMNRHMTEVGSALLPPERQRETAHRYMLGLYRTMEAITTAFPHVLFESCSGGGGRFDPGILYYMPQTWTSDNTDAISRLKIQYGTSMVYPIVSMGSHVSVTPNHQVGRNTSFDIRGHAAMSGNLGYELDLTKLVSEERETVAKQVALYKEIRPLVQFGDFYRLESPFEGDTAGWAFISEDREEAVAFYFQMFGEANAPLTRFRLKGLDPNKDYRLADTGEVYGGDELMSVGINLPYLHGDYQSVMYRFQAV